MDSKSIYAVLSFSAAHGGWVVDPSQDEVLAILTEGLSVSAKTLSPHTQLQDVCSFFVIMLDGGCKGQPTGPVVDFADSGKMHSLGFVLMTNTPNGDTKFPGQTKFWKRR